VEVRWYLYNGHLTTEHHNHTHLEDDSEGVADVVGVKLLEALGAVSALEEERIPHGGIGEALLQIASLSGEDDRRERFEALEHLLELLLVRVFRELLGLFGLPAVHGPLGLMPLLLLFAVGYYTYGLVGRVNGLDGPGLGPGNGVALGSGGMRERVGWKNGFGWKERVVSGGGHCGCVYRISHGDR